jgi:hypothetical protein
VVKGVEWIKRDWVGLIDLWIVSLRVGSDKFGLIKGKDLLVG